jgi:hypothetical protein
MIEMQRLDKLRVIFRIAAEWENLTCQQCGLVAVDTVHRGLKH